MNQWQADVLAFHEKFGCYVKPDGPGIPLNPDEPILRARLIEEETDETLAAIERGDLVEIADGIIDSLYVLIGTAVTYGISLDPLWDMVHESNMAKIGGGKDSGGKVSKPDGWRPPAVQDEILRQIACGV